MLGLLTAMLLSDFTFFILATVSLIAVACALLYKGDNKISLLVGLLCIGIGVLSYSAVYNAKVVPVSTLCDKNAVVTATITDKVYLDNGKCKYNLETTSVLPYTENKEESTNKNIDSSDDKSDKIYLEVDCPQNIKLQIITNSDFYAEIYENIRAEVKFSESVKSPYIFHQISEGIYINAMLIDTNAEILSEKTMPWYSFMDNVRSDIESKLKIHLTNRQSNLLSALLLGDKTGIDSAVKDNFRNAGISHIIVVSGLHLSVITSFIFTVVQKVLKSRKSASTITICVILFYVALTGFQYSVIRSAVMNIIYLLSYFVYRKPQALNSLGFALLVITLFNPLSAGNLGLLMSFSATLGIITLQSQLNNIIICRIPQKLKKGKGRVVFKLLKYISDCITVSISATIFTLPIMVFVFERFSVYFILSNLLVTALAPVVIIVGFTMVIIGYIPVLNFLNIPIGFVEGILCDFIIWISSSISELPLAVISLSNFYIKLAMMVVLIVLVIYFVSQNFKIEHIGVCTAFCIAVAVMIISGGCLVTSQSVSFYVIDTGKGVTLIEKSIYGTNILLCGGNSYNFGNVENILYGETVNSLLMAGNKSYYNQYADRIIDEFNVNQILLYDIDENKSLYDIFDNTVYIDDNTNIAYNNYEVKIITPQSKSWLYINCGNSSILVSPENGDCNELPEEYRKANIVILQNGCIDSNLLTADNVVFCGKEENHEYYYTDNGNVVLYKHAEEGINIWQS